MAYDYKDMSIEDLSKIVANKRSAGNIYTGTQKWDTPEQLKLKTDNDAIRQRYGIVGDDINLQAAEALLKQKQDDANPLKGYSSGKAQFSETPLDSYTVKGTEGLYNNLFGSGVENMLKSDGASAIRKEFDRAGENAYNSAIGNMTEFTGGRLNSWAAKAAADSKQDYADKGDAAVTDYVMKLLSGQQTFVNNNAANSTGIWDRAMYEKQQPIDNQLANRELDIKASNAQAQINNSLKQSGSSKGSGTGKGSKTAEQQPITKNQVDAAIYSLSPKDAIAELSDPAVRTDYIERFGRSAYDSLIKALRNDPGVQTDYSSYGE